MGCGASSAVQQIEIAPAAEEPREDEETSITATPTGVTLVAPPQAEAGAAMLYYGQPQFQESNVGTFASVGALFDGLEQLIGKPKTVEPVTLMKDEHTAVSQGLGVSDAEFTTSNTGITSTPRREWSYVMDGSADFMFRDNDLRASRVAKPYQHYVGNACSLINESFQVVHAATWTVLHHDGPNHLGSLPGRALGGLDHAGAVHRSQPSRVGGHRAAALQRTHVGKCPARRLAHSTWALMPRVLARFMFYNCVLRAFGGEPETRGKVTHGRFKGEMVADRFVKTLHSINDGILKLSQLSFTDRCSYCTKEMIKHCLTLTCMPPLWLRGILKLSHRPSHSVYRGIANLKLPDRFLVADAQVTHWPNVLRPPQPPPPHTHHPKLRQRIGIGWGAGRARRCGVRLHVDQPEQERGGRVLQEPERRADHADERVCPTTARPQPPRCPPAALLLPCLPLRGTLTVATGDDDDDDDDG